MSVPLAKNEQQHSPGFDALLQAREAHFAAGGEHEMWIIRELSGLAVGLRCVPCKWEWWRPGWEREPKEVIRRG